MKTARKGRHLRRDSRPFHHRDMPPAITEAGFLALHFLRSGKVSVVYRNSPFQLTSVATTFKCIGVKVTLDHILGASSEFTGPLLIRRASSATSFWIQTSELLILPRSDFQSYLSFGDTLQELTWSVTHQAVVYSRALELVHSCGLGKRCWNLPSMQTQAQGRVCRSSYSQIIS